MTDSNQKITRPSWDDYFMELAFVIARRSTCLSRKVGAVVVRDKRIMTTGYNGAPSGVESCLERGYCYRRKLGIPSGEKLELCRGSHAEENAIVQAAKFGISLDGATIYCTIRPCLICSKMIINAGIKKVVCKGDYPHEMGLEMFKEAGVEFILYDKPIENIIIEEK
ncbi:cytidine/deoxycytidylate deaminase family protein [bacterium]|nr:cytidine/deoxycytidylate deaminase family protein [bacterium]